MQSPSFHLPPQYPPLHLASTIPPTRHAASHTRSRPSPSNSLFLLRPNGSNNIGSSFPPGTEDQDEAEGFDTDDFSTYGGASEEAHRNRSNPQKGTWVKPGARAVRGSSLTENGNVYVDSNRGAASNFDFKYPKANARGGGLRGSERGTLITSVLTASHVVSALDSVRDKLDAEGFNIILREFGNRRKWQEISKVFDWMRMNKKVNDPSFTTFISLMGKAGHPESALRVFSSLHGTELRRNTIICNSLLKTLIHAGNGEKAFAIFEQQKLEGFVPDIITYSTMLTGCTKLRNGYAKAESLLQEMLERGLRPDAFIYASFLNICAIFGLEEEAVVTFEKIKADGLVPNIFHYSCLLNMYAEKGKAEEAERVLVDIREAGLTMNRVTLHSLMKAYTNSGLLKKAKKMFDEMESLGFRPTEVSYCLLLDAYTKVNSVDEAQALFDEMKGKGIKPGSYAYCILISFYSKIGKLENVKALAEEVHSSQNCSWDLVLFNSLLKSYCEWRYAEGVSDTLEKMHDAGHEPDRATFNILIVYFCKENLFELALRTLEDLKSRCLRPNLNTYAPIISGLTDIDQMDEALRLFYDMRQQSIVPSVRLYEILVKALCKEKRLPEALHFLNEMKARKMTASPSCLEKFLIAGNSQMELVKEIFDEDAHFLPSLEQIDYDSVFQSFEEQGNYNELYDLLECMKRHKCVPNKESLNRFIEKKKGLGESEVITRILQYFPEAMDKEMALL